MKKVFYIAPQTEHLEIETECCFATSGNENSINLCSMESGEVSSNEEEW
jgi:hypothetical protein